jgi:hypothetical protein
LDEGSLFSIKPSGFHMYNLASLKSNKTILSIE